jgi:amino acid adenylation domain-containing protein
MGKALTVEGRVVAEDERLAARIAGLTAEQRALFDQLRRRQAVRRAPAPPPIPPVSGATGEGDWPLSLDQERFWFMEQLYANRAGLNITAATRMRGPLAVPAVAHALAGIVRRHAAWRTAFPEAGGRPIQRVAPPLPAGASAVLPMADLGGLPAARREAEALRLVGLDTAAPFDLERGPLVRASLLRMGGGDHVCVLTVHHLVTDWISVQIAWAELAAAYEALAAGRTPALAAPPVQFPDYAMWQRGWLEGEVLDGLIAWWRQQLADVPLALDLSTDRPRPAVGRMRGARRTFVLPDELSAALRAGAREHGVTLFMAMLAVTAALLHRDSGQERLILGANNANRNRPEIEAVLGCFLTQVPFAIDLRGDPAWSELLGRVRQSALGAFAHQDLPFGKLVEALQLRRDLSRQPVVQVLVQVLDGQYSKADLAGVTFEAVDAHDGRARYDLMLSLTDFGTSIAGSLEYDADLFDAVTVAVWVERFMLQAAAAVADPGLRLSALPPLSPAARHQVTLEWNGIAAPPPSWTAPERFAAQAARTPEALAVAAPAESLTYGGLAQRAARLARQLLARGVGRGSRVALALERTADVPVAILGVWQAGAAYVPLDLTAPARRLAWMIADAEPDVVLYRGELPEGLAGRADDRCLDVGDAGAVANPDAFGAPPATLPDPPAAGDLAYILYTSGTTGQPKGVMVEHGNLAATLANLLALFGLGPGDRVPHLARYTFDASLLEIFLPLISGGSVEIVPADDLLEPARQIEVLGRASCVFAVPALMRRLAAAAREAGPQRFGGLRGLGAGGEAVPADVRLALLASFPGAALNVLYGPTEGTIICAAHRVERGSRQSERSLIGRPLPGVEARVVARHLAGGALAPLGAPGELWVGGPGVARGYFRRDEATAERFVMADGRRFYRTGDMVRWLPAAGGILEFLGRTDFQVKVRGVRIEPAEIEAALTEHPAVAQAVVVARPDGAGSNRLVAYWVPAAAAGPLAMPAGSTSAAVATAALRAHLAERLPAAYLPAAWVELAELPLNAHGKVDRERLPDEAADTAAAEPPAGPAEEIVAGIWCEVLGLRAVARHASFFELGGHSLLATQVMSRLRAATGAELPVRTLFQAPTVAALAAALTSALADAAAGAAAPRIGRAPRGGPLPLSFAQERLWFLDRLAPGTAAYTIPLALAAHGDLSPAALAAALGEMVRRHEALRTRFAFTAADDAPGGSAGGFTIAGTPGRSAGASIIAGTPGRLAGGFTIAGTPGGSAGASTIAGTPGRSLVPRQVVETAGRWRLPMADLSALPAAARGAEARQVVDAEVGRGFDLVNGPVLRSLALRLGATEHVLLLTVHHIAADGWSVGVMVDEIMALYPAALYGLPSPLPELAVQYGDFAVWQRNWLCGEVLDRQLEYWRGKLAGAPRLALPSDRPRPPAPSFRGATRMGSLPPAAAGAAEDLARRCDATLFMVLLAAFQALLGRYSGQDDIVVGSPIANRNRAEIEPLAGFFVNSLVLRGDLSGDPSFADLLARTRRTALEAYSHQDLPFERLVEELRPERRLAENPLFQVMCAMQNAPLREIGLPGLRFSPVDLSFPATRFDLEIHFSQHAGTLESASRRSPAAGGQETPQTPAACLAVQVTYSTDLFDPATMIRLLGHFETLLAGAAADPARQLSRLPLLAEAERHQLLREWNDTRAEVPREEVAALFFGQARRRPGAAALRTEDGAVTYGDLAERAVRLGLRLAAAGVGPEVRVGLLAPRSAAAIEGILGILAAGGAYVPLDPGHPAERLALLLADSRASVLLATRDLAERLPAGVVLGLGRESDDATAAPGVGGGGGGTARWVDLAPLSAGGAVAPAAGAAAPAAEKAGEGWAAWWERWSAGRRSGPEGLAYVMYTSGSTGRPKGVGIPHRGIVRLVRGSGFARLGADEVFLQLAPLAFDASTLEIWGPLLNGGSLALLPAASERRPSLGDIGAAVARFGVSTLWLTAGLFHQMVDEDLAALAPLGQLLAGGDVLSPAHVRRALAALPGVRLINGYGPTEATTFTACQPLRDMSDVGSSVALGRPIGNTRVYILGADREPAPVGVWGELWVGGEGLARGYLALPAATAESFSPDPFTAAGEGAGERLYRTGDVARRLADGRLEYRGRRDGQVKLRGFRIELGEVEGVLARHPQVAAAAAAMIARQGGGGLDQRPDQRLVAYVVPRPPAAGPAAAGAPGEGGGSAASYVAQWRELYEQTYAQAPPATAGGDATFNVQGWNSSYTGEPIAAAEMREWVETTVGRIAGLGRRRILEVGCGTGLLLLRLAPEAERYRGTDFSAVALAGLRRQLERPERALGRVELEEAAADDWSAVAPGDFDLVVLNSVVQYFPGADYLLRVLRSAVAALTPASGGGTIFVGDVRSLPLLEAFYTSIEMHRAAGSLAVPEMVRRVRRQVAAEEELALDPAFFLALPRHLPGIRQVRLMLHRGRHANELTRFRYDVVLEVGAAAAHGLAPSAAAAPALHWSADRLTMESLERLLAPPPAAIAGAPSPAAIGGAPSPAAMAGAPVGVATPGAAAAERSAFAAAPPAALVVAGIPNARLAAEAAALDVLAGREVPGTVADLRAATDRRLSALAADPASRPLEPETLWRLAERLGYDLDLAWPLASGGADGRLEARFHRRGTARSNAFSGVSGERPRGGESAGVGADGAAAWWSSWANDPLRAAAQRRLVPELRRMLEAQLPEPMVPSAIVLLDHLPLTPNGKVDRAALPAPETLGEAAETFVAPSTPLEELLAKVTAEVLGIERAGMRDNFFALGGHSLLATQLVSRLAQQHALPLTLQMVFDAADLGELADLIVQREIESVDGALLDEALQGLHGGAP